MHTHKLYDRNGIKASVEVVTEVCVAAALPTLSHDGFVWCMWASVYLLSRGTLLSGVVSKTASVQTPDSRCRYGDTRGGVTGKEEVLAREYYGSCVLEALVRASPLQTQETGIIVITCQL